MNLSKTSNPALSQRVIQRSKAAAGQDAMTVKGTINKVALMLILLVVSAAFVVNDFVSGGTNTTIWIAVGGIGGFITALVTIFRPQSSPISAPIYALLEGLLLGGISAFFETMYPGIAAKAVALTFAVLFMMLFLYRSGIIKVTQKFRMGVVAATGGLALFYLLSMVLGLFGVDLPILYSSSPLGIGFSLIVVGLAALNLVLDFDFIDRAANEGAPQYMEWYGAFGLMVTLVWLYLEILRLLARFASND